LAPVSQSPSDWLKWLIFEIGAGYYARKLATGPEAELRREFADFLQLKPGERVLDVGCGPGHLARLLALRGCRVTGVDRGRRLLRIARRWAAREGAALEFRQAPADQLPFPDGTFDCTLATTVLYFVADAEAALREIVRVTRPGGAVATLDPHASMSIPAAHEYCRRQNLNSQDTRKLLAWAAAAELNRRFEETELCGLLESAGLTEVQMERRLGGLVWFARGAVAGQG
jgi:ubiquinone/menaquinone biosynthesis C-methylase UbiE